MLKNTLFIPSYPQCIFYVQSAIKNGAILNLKDDSAKLVSSDGKKFPIVEKRRLDYLYKVASKEIRKENLSVWDKIKGHCNINDLKKLEMLLKVLKLKIMMKLVVKPVS